MHLYHQNKNSVNTISLDLSIWNLVIKSLSLKVTENNYMYSSSLQEHYTSQGIHYL